MSFFVWKDLFLAGCVWLSQIFWIKWGLNSQSWHSAAPYDSCIMRTEQHIQHYWPVKLLSSLSYRIRAWFIPLDPLHWCLQAVSDTSVLHVQKKSELFRVYITSHSIRPLKEGGGGACVRKRHQWGDIDLLAIATNHTMCGCLILERVQMFCCFYWLDQQIPFTSTKDKSLNCPSLEVCAVSPIYVINRVVITQAKTHRHTHKPLPSLWWRAFRSAFQSAHLEKV